MKSIEDVNIKKILNNASGGKVSRDPQNVEQHCYMGSPMRPTEVATRFRSFNFILFLFSTLLVLYN